MTPPVRLTVEIETPSGSTSRWSTDESDPQYVPTALNFATTMPGGFDHAGCTLARKPGLDYADLERLSKVTFRGVGGEIAYQGRLETAPATSGDQLAITPGIVGFQAHLDDDNTAREIYVDRQQASYTDPPVNRQIWLLQNGYALGSSSSTPSPADQLPALSLQVDGMWTTAIPVAEAWYDAGWPGAIGKAFVAFTPGPAVGGGLWSEAAYITDADALTTTVASSGNITSAAPVVTTIAGASGAGGRYVVLQHHYSAQSSGTDGFSYLMFGRPVMYGTHGLPLQGPAGAPQGVLSSDVEAHAVRRWAPKLNFTTGPEGTIKPSVFAIPQLMFKDPTTVSQIIKGATQYELRDWAVWEGPDGEPTYYSNARGDSGNQWRARVGPTRLQETGPQVSRLWNQVIVSYTDVDGSTRSVGPPGSRANYTDVRLSDSDPLNPCNQAGIVRCATVTMGTSTAPGAIAVGQVFLMAQKKLDTSGQASIVGYIEDTSGIVWPAWKVRGGDYITFMDAANTTPRRVVSTSYDAASATNQVTLDSPPDGLSALLQRMSIVLTDIGFS